MRLFILSIIIIIPIFIAKSQSLRDSLFLAKFKKTTYDLNNLKPELKRIEWELIAGFCQQSDKKYSDSEMNEFSAFIDSIRYIERQKINIRWNLCENECERHYLNCLMDNIGEDDNQNKYCDSLQTICERRCSKIDDDEYDSLKNALDNKWSEFRYSYNYVIEQRYGNNELLRAKFSDGIFCKSSGFGTWCPPDWCTWMILTKNRKQAEIVDSFEELSDFLGKIDNASEAYLLFKGSGLEPSSGFPIGKFAFQYHTDGSNFYILQELQLSDCPIERYQCLIQVRKGKPAIILDKKLIYESDICI